VRRQWAQRKPIRRKSLYSFHPTLTGGADVSGFGRNMVTGTATLQPGLIKPWEGPYSRRFVGKVAAVSPWELLSAEACFEASQITWSNVPPSGGGSGGARRPRRRGAALVALIGGDA
jgi:hypothetical protein